jgi:hypothetical protein
LAYYSFTLTWGKIRFSDSQKSLGYDFAFCGDFYSLGTSGCLGRTGNHDQDHGSKFGYAGVLIAYLLGSAAAGPLYAAFPVAGVLLKKGCHFF